MSGPDIGRDLMKAKGSLKDVLGSTHFGVADVWRV